MNRTNPNAASRTHQGFTLIELMIVVAIITIIAAIGYPSYIQHTTKARRAAAEGFMLSVANKQEQYMLDARTYADTLTKLNLSVPAEVRPYYDIAIAGASNTAYSITATPLAGQLKNDTDCGTLGLDQSGKKTVSSTSPASTRCWS